MNSFWTHATWILAPSSATGNQFNADNFIGILGGFAPNAMPQGLRPGRTQLQNAPERGLTVYDPAFAARQILKGGRVHVNDLKRMVPGGIPNTFTPSTTIPGGSKFKYEVNGTKVEIKWHAPDAVAARKFPGSRSGAMWTAQIKIGKKLLGSDGRLYNKPSDLTHIPIDF
jgi:filamentous hemagglutinin